MTRSSRPYPLSAPAQVPAAGKTRSFAQRTQDIENACVALNSSAACAKLATIRPIDIDVVDAGTRPKKETIVLSLTRPVTIGRKPGVCTYVVADMVISSLHCKICVVRSGVGGIIVSCQDMSSNGIKLNGQKIRKTSVILMDGDIVELPNGQEFHCTHLWKPPKEKINFFDPTPPLHPITKRIGQYVVTSHCLGAGGYASVYLAQDETRHRQVACKVIPFKRATDMNSILKEFSILAMLNHPNINCVYNVEESDGFLHIFLELSTGGDLLTYITASPDRGLCEGEAKYVMFQLLKGLEYLHSKFISHRDLKPENLLLHTPGPYPRIQIADFGLARQRGWQETFNACGTVSYLPPEGILALEYKNRKYVGMPADCWSAGVILYIMLTGMHPFESGLRDSDEDSYDGDYPLVSDESSGDLYISNSRPGRRRGDQVTKNMIVNGAVGFHDPLWVEMPEAKALVSRLTTWNPDHRATAYAALNSKWITDEHVELENAYQERILTA